MNRLMVTYYALLREKRGCATEKVETTARTAAELYDELCGEYGLRLPRNVVKVSINHELQPWDTPLKNGDEVGFLPPVSGG